MNNLVRPSYGKVLGSDVIQMQITAADNVLKVIGVVERETICSQYVSE